MTRENVEYSESEVRAILTRAAEMQGSDTGNTEGSGGTGLTRNELDEIGSVAGIDARFITAAIAELDSASDANQTNWWGGPVSVSIEGIASRELTDEDWERVLSRLRHSLGQHGVVTSRRLVKEWSSSEGTSGEGYLLTAASKGNGSRLTLSWHNPVLPAPFYVISTVLTVILIPVIFESLGLVSATGAFFFLLAASALFAVARFGIVRSVEAKRKALQTLMTSITSDLAETSTGTPVSSTVSFSDPERARPDILDPVDDAYDAQSSDTAVRRKQAE